MRLGKAWDTRKRRAQMLPLVTKSFECPPLDGEVAGRLKLARPMRNGCFTTTILALRPCRPIKR